ncbi:MAG TPA: glutaminyl-peptide cyclotransferase, partial [Allosphingosinicella sp.]
MRSAVAFMLLAACQAAPSQPQASTASTLGQEPAVAGYRVVATYPHDREAFTQGLFFLDGELYESTGLVGRSTVRRVNIEDGAVRQSVAIPRNMFGEGITNWGNQIISITWQTG